MRVLIWILVLLLIFLQYKFWNSRNGLWKTFTLHKEIAAEQKTHDKLLNNNQKLAAQIYQLKHNKNSVESLARTNLGMVKPGEKYYRIVEEKNAK